MNLFIIMLISSFLDIRFQPRVVPIPGRSLMDTASKTLGEGRTAARAVDKICFCIGGYLRYLPVVQGCVGWLAEGWLTETVLFRQDQLSLTGHSQAVDLTPVDDFELVASRHQTIAVDLSAGTGEGQAALGCR
jgi:hypothetical protein